MSYKVKEIFYTLQGEGFNTGRASVFCRFTGCNLWSGHEKDRAAARCSFCDTDFVGTDGPGGGVFKNAASLTHALLACWREGNHKISDISPFVVFTGGEPLLQLDDELIAEVKASGFEIAVETNGTIPAPAGIDWLTVSPKPNSEWVQRRGDELKLVYPQEVTPEMVEDGEFKYYYLSPRDDFDPEKTHSNTQAALDYCRDNPKWRLTMQHHKVWSIP